MENSFENVAENIADFAEANSHQSYFFSCFNNAGGPGDEDEEKGEGEGEGNDDENPVLDPNIVHSPVPPQTGGKPPSAKPFSL